MCPLLSSRDRAGLPESGLKLGIAAALRLPRLAVASGTEEVMEIHKSTVWRRRLRASPVYKAYDRRRG